MSKGEKGITTELEDRMIEDIKVYLTLKEHCEFEGMELPKPLKLSEMK